MLSSHPPSPHALHAEDFLALERDDWLVAEIERAAGTSNRSPRSWRRTFARFDAARSRPFTLIYETLDGPQELVTVTLSRGVPDQTPACPTGTSSKVGFQRFPNDPSLPGLGKVLAASKDVRVLRYRPGRRCTLRAALAGRPAIAKVFPDSDGARIHRDGFELARAASELLFRVAQPLDWDRTSCTLWQELLPGSPVFETLRSSSGVARDMGAALASLACAPLRPDARFLAVDQMSRSARYGRALARQVPGAVARVEELLMQLQTRHDNARSRPGVPIHGSPHVHQWLRDGDALALVDFDRLALGEPELDVATFLAEMDFEDPNEIRVAEINESFLEGYRSVWPELDPIRIQTYRAHKHLSKALRAARSIRRDGDRRALRYLRSALALARGDQVSPELAIEVGGGQVAE